jgi:hypothetical protein
MLPERELRILAEIEARMVADEPGLVRLLNRGGRFAVLLRPEPHVARGLVAVCLTVLLGAAAVFVGSVAGVVPLVAVGLVGVIVAPLPVWMLGTVRRDSAGGHSLVR